MGEHLLALPDTKVTPPLPPASQETNPPYLVTFSSSRWRGAVLVLLLVSAHVLLLGGDGVRVDPHEVRHVAQHVDLILDVIEFNTPEPVPKFSKKIFEEISKFESFTKFSIMILIKLKRTQYLKDI